MGRQEVTESPLDRRLRALLAEQRARDLYRVRRVVDGSHGARMRADGRALVNFCSNDYLGLAADPRVAEAARRALTKDGTGSGAAALISGYNREHARLEEELAAFLGRPRVLLFSSGWAANLGVLRALLAKNDTLIGDELNHASLIDGGRLSGARYVRVAHRDVAAFADALRQAGERVLSFSKDGGSQALTLVATDAVFSMDGDLAPLSGLGPLCREHGAALMVDDAHGFGVLGENGRGVVDLLRPQDIYVATLGKALGCAGAFVAGSEALVEYLIQRARSWVFSTAPPPALAAAARESLRILQAEPERRARLFDNIRRFRACAGEAGIALGSPPEANPDSRLSTPIQPLVLGDESRALALSRFLFERGLWVAAIRPPTVPQGTARMRIALSAAHASADIEQLVEALAAGLRALGEPA